MENENHKVSSLIRSAADLGRKARIQRKRQHIPIEQAAPLMNLGARFISEVERGKETAELGKVLQLLDGIGLAVLVLPKSLALKVDRELSREYDHEPTSGRKRRG